MSKDLYINTDRPIAVKPLLSSIKAVLSELLGLAAVPAPRLERLENGERVAADIDRIGTDGGPLLELSINGDVVWLGGSPDYVAVTISGAGNCVQYALGAAAAIVLARESGGRISDDCRFFGEEVHTTPEAMLARLRVVGSYSDYREAAEAIRWG